MVDWRIRNAYPLDVYSSGKGNKDDKDNDDKGKGNDGMDKGDKDNDDKDNEDLLTMFYMHVQDYVDHGAVKSCGNYFASAPWEESLESVKTTKWKCKVCIDAVRECFPTEYDVAKEADPQHR